MQPTLHEIRKACNRIGGGLQNLLLIDPRDLASPPVGGLSVNVDALDFKPGKSPYLFEQDRFSGSLESDTDVGSAAGDFFTWRLQATVKNIRPLVESLRTKLINRRVHVVGTYRDGLQQFVPFMRLRAKGSSGLKFSDKQGYQFIGETRSFIIPPTIGETLSIEPGGGGGGGTPDDMAPTPITTSSSSTSFTVPGGKLLDAIVIKSTSAQSINVGLTPGGSELSEAFDMGADQWAKLSSALYYDTSNYTVYFSNLAGSNTILLYLW